MSQPKFTPDQVGSVVGTITITAVVTEDEHYECAAWYRRHEFVPGTYEITLVEKSRSSPVSSDPRVPWQKYVDHYQLVAKDVPTKIVEAYFGTLYGGVAIGTDRAGPREVGKDATRNLNLGFSYKLETLDAYSFWTKQGVTIQFNEVTA